MVADVGIRGEVRIIAGVGTPFEARIAADVGIRGEVRIIAVVGTPTKARIVVGDVGRLARVGERLEVVIEGPARVGTGVLVRPGVRVRLSVEVCNALRAARRTRDAPGVLARARPEFGTLIDIADTGPAELLLQLGSVVR